MRKKEIDIISLGCSKNLVDAERLMRQLQAIGYTCTHDAQDPKGEIALINTCGFIGDAKEESINTILAFAERKTEGKIKKLYVMGCLSERYLHELEEEIPEVDAWFGKFNYMDLLDCLAKAKVEESIVHERKITTPSHHAYLKISEGCNRFCSYCAIPLITGRHTSRRKEELLEEVKWLVRQGVKEINVIAQDLSSYGLDLYGKHCLAELIDEIAQVKGVEWIRLHYAYPTDFPEELLAVMAKHENICKYLDIALQHTTDHMLQQMRRRITSKEQDDLIAKIREAIPGICIRTTLLVGHPGESEADFEALKEWVKKMRFDRMGAFAYSNEEGTYAYKHYEDNIDQDVKERRVAEIMAIQEKISWELQQEKVGKIEKVIVDREEGEYYIGRTQYDSPDVDCEVLIDKAQALEIGEFYKVRITKAEEFDLIGSVVNEESK